MATTLSPAPAPDGLLSFELNPGTLLQFLEARAEKGPRLKCFEGSVTLVSPGMTHESAGFRLNLLIVAVCFGLGLPLKGLASTTWTLPLGAGDTAYEPDAVYHIRRRERPKRHQPPDLAIEILVFNPARKALRAAAFLKIPELWVLDIPRHNLTFYHLTTRGQDKGSYLPKSRGRAFPFLTSDEVLERLDDLEADDPIFQEDCRVWVRDVLAPLLTAENGGA